MTYIERLETHRDFLKEMGETSKVQVLQEMIEDERQRIHVTDSLDGCIEDLIRLRDCVNRLEMVPWTTALEEIRARLDDIDSLKS